MDESRAVDFELAPNQASLHHAKIIHGADANASDSWRVGYAIRYYSQAMRYDPARNPASHKLFHARGRNVAGNPGGRTRLCLTAPRLLRPARFPPALRHTTRPMRPHCPPSRSPPRSKFARSRYGRSYQT